MQTGFIGVPPVTPAPGSAVLWPVTGTFIASASCSKGISSVVRVPGMKKVNACAQGRQCTLAAFGKEVPPCVGQPI